MNALEDAKTLVAKTSKPYPGDSDEYRRARATLLVEEIELRRHLACVAEQRRNLPLGGEPPPFDFLDENGKTLSLADLFGRHDTLVTYFWMYGPQRERPCPMCTSLLGSIDIPAKDVEQRVAFAVLGRSPVSRQLAFARERGWRNLSFYQCVGDEFPKAYRGLAADGSEWASLDVWVRKGEGCITSGLVKAPAHKIPGRIPTWPRRLLPSGIFSILRPGGVGPTGIQSSPTNDTRGEMDASGWRSAGHLRPIALVECPTLKEIPMYDQSKLSELIRFARVDAGSTVIDVYPGDGDWTRLFSEIVGPEGRVYSFVPSEVADFKNDPVGRVRMLAKEPGRENVEAVSADLVAMPQVTQPADVLWLHLFYHDLHTALIQAKGATAAHFNRAVYERLKPGGSYVVVDHAAAVGAGTSDAQSLHRIEPASVREEVEAAGFVLDAESTVLANKDDQHSIKVFDPSIKGETDRFAFRFVKR